MFGRISLLLTLVLVMVETTAAQDRDTKVRNDREAFKNNERWVYNSLDDGLAEARRTGKPLLVVFRCIPCEACAGFDEQVARRDARIDGLMEKFVCVRIVQANAMDLNLFQFDYDMSFAAVFINADRTIYGRFGSMSNHDNAERDISIEGFGKALAGALELHRNYPANKASLTAKQGPPPRFKAPEEYPSLKKYNPQLDYAGKVAQSCIHCHQVRNAEQEYLRAAGTPLTDAVLYPWPMPDAVGLALDPKEKAKVSAVAPGSVAERAGFRAGDELLSLEGQPLLSIADVQWVLHSAAEPAQLKAEILRDGKTLTLTLPLAKGWRQGIDFSWRPTTWVFRGMGLGGMLLRELSADERRQAGLGESDLGLRAKWVPPAKNGIHGAAARAGFKIDDILVSFEGKTARIGEKVILEYTLRQKRPGDQVPVVVLRGNERIELKLPVQ